MINLRTHRISIHWTILFIAAVLWPVTQSANAVELDEQTLRYNVTYITHDAGELEIVISRENNQIKTKAISHLSTLARMFLSGLTAETWFSIEGEKLQLERGHLLSHDNATIMTSFEIDRNRGNLKFVPEKDADAVKPTDIFESTSFPLVLVSSDISSIAGQQIREISPKRVRTYVYLAPEVETLELNGNTYDTWKVIRHKLGDPTRTVTIWLDRNAQQIPVRIVTVKDKKTTEITLISRS
jgi:hypothetical protein